MHVMIREWMINLTAIAIFCIFMDMMVPKGSMKKYIRFILGIIILCVLLSPLTNFLGNIPDIESVIHQNIIKIEMQKLDYQIELLDERQKQQIEELFAYRLESTIKDQIKTLIGDERINVNVLLTSDKNSPIEQIHVDIVKEDVYSKKLQAVDMVVIDMGSNNILDKSPDIKNEETKEEMDIKKYLSNMYDVREENIFVTINR